MGYINIRIDDEIERRFRTRVSEKGGKRGDLSKALEEAIKLWMDKTKMEVS